NGIDDDGNGYADDVHGANIVASSGDPQDDNRHGTHVAGTVAATRHNGFGVAGVAPAVRLVSAKVLDARGAGSVFDAIKGLEYLMALKQSGKAHIIAVNASWGTTYPSEALAEVIGKLDAAGIVLVTAAGNA